MTVRAYYATHSTGSYREHAVLLLDDEIPEERGLAETGYFVQLKTPETVEHGAGQGDEDRAR
jgi:hypothetical protein